MFRKKIRLIMPAFLALAGSLYLSCDLLMPPKQLDFSITREITIYPQDDGYVDLSGGSDFSGILMNISDSNYITLLRFNVDEIPDDSRILMARLSLKTTTIATAGDLGCYPIIQEWDTASIDYATTDSTLFYDSFEELFSGFVLDNGDDDYKVFRWGLRGPVQAWVSGSSNRGILIKAPDEGGTGTNMKFYTSESDYPPEIFIRYEVDISGEDE